MLNRCLFICISIHPSVHTAHPFVIHPSKHVSSIRPNVFPSIHSSNHTTNDIPFPSTSSLLFFSVSPTHRSPVSFPASAGSSCSRDFEGCCVCGAVEPCRRCQACSRQYVVVPHCHILDVDIRLCGTKCDEDYQCTKPVLHYFNENTNYKVFYCNGKRSHD